MGYSRAQGCIDMIYEWFLTVFRYLAACMAMQFVSVTFAQDSNPPGQMLFNNHCRTCHTLRDGDNRLGPHLKGVVGRKAGAVQGYPYSSALANSDLTWEASTLDRFIASPEEVAPGHQMRPYSGMTSSEDRAKLITFLASQE